MKVRLPGNSGSGINNMQQLMRQAQKTQEEIEKASKDLEAREYSATSGGEAVKVTVSGKMEVLKIEINPEVASPEDVDILSDMIKAGINEAIKKAKTEKDSVMESISGQMNLPGIF